jgi:MFS family permease
MKFVSDVRLLLLSIWLGSAVFFIGVAQSAFAVLPQRELAGAVVNRTLSILNIGGIVIAVFLFLSSFIAAKNLNRYSVWAERFMLLLVAVACSIGQFVIGFWLSMLRGQMARPIDEVAADDPLRIQFNNLHEWSVWVLFGGMVAALIAFFIIANRKFGAAAKTTTNDPYDFSKEFKI